MAIERIKAGDILPGHLVARARTHAFRRVTRTVRGDVSVWLYLEGAGRVRPRMNADWWVQSDGPKRPAMPKQAIGGSDYHGQPDEG